MLSHLRRSIFTLAVASATLALPFITSAQSVTTIPVGFNTSVVPAAVDASNPSSTVLSAPFYTPADFTGAVGSVDSANQLSITGAAFAAGQFTATPHLARMKSGPSAGRFFLITSHTATQLTVDALGYSLTSAAPASTTQTQVTVGDSCEILPANTLGTLFGTSTVPFQTGATAADGDNVYLFNGTSWDVFYHNGTNWKRSGSLVNQNNAVVYPDRGLFVLRRATTPLNLTFLGTVPSSTERTDFPGAVSSFKSVRFPVDTTLLGLSLQSLPNWLAGATAADSDNVYLWNGTSWSVFYYNGANWKKSGSLVNANTQVIPLGTAMFVVRQSAATGSQSTLVQTLPYTL